MRIRTNDFFFFHQVIHFGYKSVWTKEWVLIVGRIKQYLLFLLQRKNLRCFLRLFYQSQLPLKMIPLLNINFSSLFQNCDVPNINNDYFVILS